MSTDSLYCDGLFASIERANQPKLKIYPNPVNNYLFIEGYENYSEFKLYNIYGLEVNIKQYSNYIDVSHIEAGTYFLKYITKENKSYTYKLIKQ